MTPERARMIAGEHGCSFGLWSMTVYRIERNAERYGFITAAALAIVTEEAFIAYFIPDKRD